MCNNIYSDVKTTHLAWGSLLSLAMKMSLLCADLSHMHVIDVRLLLKYIWLCVLFSPAGGRLVGIGLITLFVTVLSLF